MAPNPAELVKAGHDVDVEWKRLARSEGTDHGLVVLGARGDDESVDLELVDHSKEVIVVTEDGERQIPLPGPTNESDWPEPELRMPFENVRNLEGDAFRAHDQCPVEDQIPRLGSPAEGIDGQPPHDHQCER